MLPTNADQGDCNVENCSDAYRYLADTPLSREQRLQDSNGSFRKRTGCPFTCRAMKRLQPPEHVNNGGDTQEDGRILCSTMDQGSDTSKLADGEANAPAVQPRNQRFVRCTNGSLLPGLVAGCIRLCPCTRHAGSNSTHGGPRPAHQCPSSVGSRQHVRQRIASRVSIPCTWRFHANGPMGGRPSRQPSLDCTTLRPAGLLQSSHLSYWHCQGDLHQAAGKDGSRAGRVQVRCNAECGGEAMAGIHTDGRPGHVEHEQCMRTVHGGKQLAHCRRGARRERPVGVRPCLRRCRARWKPEEDRHCARELDGEEAG